MRILLVEDQPDAADILVKGLREQGYAVDLAIDGEEADFKASIAPYDLIILDVTRSDISRQVWDESYDAFSNLIEIYLGRLRRKIDSGHAVTLLHTRRGEGYVLAAAGTAR